MNTQWKFDTTWALKELNMKTKSTLYIAWILYDHYMNKNTFLHKYYILEGIDLMTPNYLRDGDVNLYNPFSPCYPQSPPAGKILLFSNLSELRESSIKKSVRWALYPPKASEVSMTKVCFSQMLRNWGMVHSVLFTKLRRGRGGSVI